MYGTYLILVLVVTGGLIAFIGDRVGTKIGKKRLSLFGLRPRHTSNIITVITGILITTLTIGIMSITSDNVRTALFGMDELNANLKSKQIALENLSDELNLVTEEYQQANEDLKKSKNEIDDLKSESDRLKEGNQELEFENEQLTSDNSALTEKNSTLTEDNDKLQSENKNLEDYNNKLREGIVAIREGDITFRAGEILASAVIKANRSADEIVKDIDDLANAATMNVSKKLGSNGKESYVWIYQPELSAAVKSIVESDSDVVMRIVAAGNLMKGESVRSNLELYKNKKIYSRDDEILAMAYEMNDEVKAEQIVRNFLKEVNKVAVKKGVLADPITGSVGVMSGNQFYQLVEAISQTKGIIFLTAIAKEETMTQGPLRLNIKLEHSKEN